MPRQADFVAQVYSAARNAGLPDVAARIAASQAALETGYGKSVKGNNLFGIKAGRSWKGDTQTFTTHEEENGRRVKIRDQFRAYDNPEDSVRDWAATMRRAFPGVLEARTLEEGISALNNGRYGAYATDSNYGSKLKWINRQYLAGDQAPARTAVAAIEQAAPTPAPAAARPSMAFAPPPAPPSPRPERQMVTSYVPPTSYTVDLDKAIGYAKDSGQLTGLPAMLPNNALYGAAQEQIAEALPSGARFDPSTNRIDVQNRGLLTNPPVDPNTGRPVDIASYVQKGIAVPNNYATAETFPLPIPRPVRTAQEPSLPERSVAAAEAATDPALAAALESRMRPQAGFFDPMQGRPLTPQTPPPMPPIPATMSPDMRLMRNPAMGPAVPPPISAPTPQPRLDRGGFFGARDLPGSLGLVNNIARAVNNSSGPFPAPIDNALYNMFRGGNQYAPSTATHQSRSGYLYRQEPEGTTRRRYDADRNEWRDVPQRYTNVGRVGGTQSYSRNESGGRRRYDPDRNEWI